MQLEIKLKNKKFCNGCPCLERSEATIISSFKKVEKHIYGRCKYYKGIKIEVTKKNNFIRLHKCKEENEKDALIKRLDKCKKEKSKKFKTSKEAMQYLAKTMAK